MGTSKSEPSTCMEVSIKGDDLEETSDWCQRKESLPSSKNEDTPLENQRFHPRWKL